MLHNLNSYLFLREKQICCIFILEKLRSLNFLSWMFNNKKRKAKFAIV